MKKYLLTGFLIFATQLVGSAQASVEFNGVDNFLELANLPEPVGDYTFEMYVLIHGAGNGLWQTLINWDSPGHTPWLATRNIGFDMEYWDVVEIFSSVNPTPTNSWFHIAYVGNATTGGQLYINGVQEGSDLNPTTPPGGYMQVGAWAAGEDPIDGKIDELRISDVARYTGNFTPNFIEFIADANTMALYHFNETSGQTAFDASGNGLHLQFGSTPGVDTHDPVWCPTSSVSAAPLVPTMSEWGILILGLLVLCVGVLTIRQRTTIALN